MPQILTCVLILDFRYAIPDRSDFHPQLHKSQTVNRTSHIAPNQRSAPGSRISGCLGERFSGFGLRSHNARNQPVKRLVQYLGCDSSRGHARKVTDLQLRLTP
jgi:hypothetical protein